MRRPKPISRTSWAILCRSRNKLDGERTWFEGDASSPAGIRLFPSRELAREHVIVAWGYLDGRPDLKAEPHGWKMPRPVKVEISVKETR